MLGIYLIVVALVVSFLFLVYQAVAAQASSLVADLPDLSSRLQALVASLPTGLVQDAASRMLGGWQSVEGLFEVACRGLAEV